MVTFNGDSVAGEKFGPLMAIGGAEDKSHDRIILRRFLDLSGNGSGRIVIIPTASRLAHAGQQYRRVFKELGADDVEILDIRDRDAADDESMAATIRESTGIFMTGGNQNRLASILRDSAVARAIKERQRHGVPVAGTSAGASVMSSVMVAGGQSGPTPRRKMAKLSEGLGLIDSVIIDQHFTERNRVSRLVTMISQHPGLLGLGIDEDTAALIHPDGLIEVIGRGSVLVVDGSRMDTNIEELNGSAPPTIANAVIHFIAEGGRYSLDDRLVVPQN